MTRDELKKAVPTAPAHACEVCGKEMAMVYNVDSRAPGPIDHRCPIYFVRKAVDGQGRPLAMTGNDLMAILKRVVVEVEGEEVVYQAGDILGWFVSHWSTCPGAARIAAEMKRRRQ